MAQSDEFLIKMESSLLSYVSWEAGEQNPFSLCPP